MFKMDKMDKVQSGLLYEKKKELKFSMNKIMHRIPDHKKALLQIKKTQGNDTATLNYIKLYQSILLIHQIKIIT